MLIGIVIGLIGLVMLACNSQNDPFDVGDLRDNRDASPTPLVSPTPLSAAAAAQPTPSGIPEPTPTVHTVGEATAQAFREEQEAKEQGVPTATPVPLDRQSDTHIKLANWSEKNINLANFIVGYILSHGFEYDIELVELEDGDYQSGFPDGEFDLVLTMDRAWHGQEGTFERIVDAGTLYEAIPDLRIGVHANIKERAPELILILGKFKPGDETLAKLEGSMILSGRIGMLPNVAALKYLKENEATWSQWVPADVLQKVKDAIAAGKSKFERREHQEIDSA